MDKREAEIENNKIVRVLTEERERQEVSRYRLAKGIGMSKSTIIYIEEFKQIPKMTTILMICCFLKISLETVLKKARKL